jgi:N-acetylglucosaminyldiphosphoundecaprenol N-acetyl-beta-D-mannosaminyltransferase
MAFATTKLRRDTLWPLPTVEDNSRPPKKRVTIGNLPLDPVTFEEAVGWTIDYIQNRGSRPPARISCPNASLIALAAEDPAFGYVVATSNLVVADGLPLLWAAAMLGSPLPEQIRGVDLLERICQAAASQGLSFYILGGLPQAADISAQQLLRQHPGLRLAGTDCPVAGFEEDRALNQAVRARIAAINPDLLIVALGSPKQEWWIYDNCRDLPVGAILGVGGAIDTIAGLRPRPPVWMRNVGLEWLGRLLAEPGRLWRRYIFGNSRFVWVVLKQWLAARST